MHALRWKLYKTILRTRRVRLMVKLRVDVILSHTVDLMVIVFDIVRILVKWNYNSNSAISPRFRCINFAHFQIRFSHVASSSYSFVRIKNHRITLYDLWREVILIFVAFNVRCSIKWLKIKKKEEEIVQVSRQHLIFWSIVKCFQCFYILRRIYNCPHFSSSAESILQQNVKTSSNEMNGPFWKQRQALKRIQIYRYTVLFDEILTKFRI